MRRPGPFDLALVTVAAAVTLLLVLRDPAAGFPEWVFGTFLLVVGGHVVRAAVASVLSARAERARAARLAATEPDAVALSAIREERRRLAEEIATALREQIGVIRDEAAALDSDDPRPGLRRIHERTQLATSELRRHLGLLRGPEPTDDPAPPPSRPTVVPRHDVVLAAVLSAVAAAEVTGYLLSEGPREHLPWSVLLSALAAGCVVGRTVKPGAACLACAALFVVGSLLGAPVSGGFWTFGTLGALVWTVAARARIASLDPAGGLLLVAAVAWSRDRDDPSNLVITMLMLAVAACGGLAVRLATRREGHARERATAREAELADAARTAVAAERAGFARELHDVTSHAVGLIAMQAAAGEVSWPHDREAVLRAVDVIDTTARSTLAELERLGPTRAITSHGIDDVHELVTRIRATGTPVDLTVLGKLPGALAPVVHRVVQEALTNAVRHAAGAAVAVTVETTADGVRVRVADDGRPSSAPGTRGFGLTGLRERVGLAGGTLTTGPGADGGYVVGALLPVAPIEGPVVAP